MANPTASATLNKASYAIGEVITLTVNHTDADRQTLTVSGVVTDSNGNTAPWSATAQLDAGTVSITATGGKTWALQSATANQSVFTTTA
jgi:NADPH-dependent ferric siderophore reductase